MPCLWFKYTKENVDWLVNQTGFNTKHRPTDFWNLDFSCIRIMLLLRFTVLDFNVPWAQSFDREGQANKANIPLPHLQRLASASYLCVCVCVCVCVRLPLPRVCSYLPIINVLFLSSRRRDVVWERQKDRWRTRRERWIRNGNERRKRGCTRLGTKQEKEVKQLLQYVEEEGGMEGAWGLWMSVKCAQSDISSR